MANNFYNKTTADSTFNPKLTISAPTNSTPLITGNTVKALKAGLGLKLTNDDATNTVIVTPDGGGSIYTSEVYTNYKVFTDRIGPASATTTVLVDNNLATTNNLTVGGALSTTGNATIGGTLTATTLATTNNLTVSNLTVTGAFTAPTSAYNPYWIAGFLSSTGTVNSSVGRYSFTANVQNSTQMLITMTGTGSSHPLGANMVIMVTPCNNDRAYVGSAITATQFRVNYTVALQNFYLMVLAPM